MKWPVPFAIRDKLIQIHGDSEVDSLLKWLARELGFRFYEYSLEEIDDQFEYIFDMLSRGVPPQYILGHAWFYGLKIQVNENVLIPRAETEELVYECLKYIPTHISMNILEIGTGSGCISLALKKERPASWIKSLDISSKALNVAIENSNLLGLRIDFEERDFLKEELWPDLGKFDIIISNPPYIASSETSEMNVSSLEFEPHIALFVEEDPLLFYKKISNFAKSYLNPGGYIFCEMNALRSAETLALFKNDHFKSEILHDLQGNPRILKVKLI